jgi:hypothetical protein
MVNPHIERDAEPSQLVGEDGFRTVYKNLDGQSIMIPSSESLSRTKSDTSFTKHANTPRLTDLAFKISMSDHREWKAPLLFTPEAARPRDMSEAKNVLPK